VNTDSENVTVGAIAHHRAPCLRWSDPDGVEKLEHLVRRHRRSTADGRHRPRGDHVDEDAHRPTVQDAPRIAESLAELQAGNRSDARRDPEELLDRLGDRIGAVRR